MVIRTNNILFLFYSLLFLDNNVFPLNLKYVSTADRNISNIKRRNIGGSRYENEIINQDFPWDDGKAANDDDDNSQQPSVPKPRQKQRGPKEGRHTIYGNLFTRRVNRATQAGYTNNADTCKIYNNNLEKVWRALSKYMGHDQETPNNMALHNIVLLLEAYLDHHSLIVNNDENIQQDSDNTSPIQENIHEIINEIKDMLENKVPKNNEEMPNKIIAMILNFVKAPLEKQEKCLESSKDKLKFDVNREYQRYVEFSSCRRVSILRKMASLQQGLEKMRPIDAKRFLRKLEQDPATNCGTVARNMLLETLEAIVNGYMIDVQCLDQ